MDNALYTKFVALKEAGKKTEANTTLEEFIASFQTHQEKQEWTWDFLERGNYGHKIRHELYSEVIFPVLLAGYRRADARSLLFLAKTAQNLYSDRLLLSQVDNKGESQLLREAYERAPTEEVRHALLRWDLNWFMYCEHEYPAGILYGNDGATLAECEEILGEIAFALTLDDGTHGAYLQEFEAKVQEYQERLKANSQ